MSKKFTAIIIEDELETRERLSRVVRESSRFECLAACENFVSGQEALIEHSPDLLLLDIDLPDGNGLELIRWLEANDKPTRTVVVTVFEDSRHVMEAVSAGAAGYVLKDDPSITIEQALLMILDGGSPISSAIARQILLKFKDSRSNNIGENTSSKIESLTPREREILLMVSDGFTDNEIAQQKNISYHTVTTHVKHIYQKLSVKTRVEATRHAIARGITEQDNDK